MNLTHIKETNPVCFVTGLKILRIVGKNQRTVALDQSKSLGL